ncbi:hypothetical protein [Streptomyces sp. NPDC005859]|uniref:hypothetical protein n=1 Tax=Streptomyces sp. NPDC005859 TaxID=3157170 RepID=UPI00340764C3
MTRWLAVWAVVTVVMGFVTRLADIYTGWPLTTVTSVALVAPWYWARRRQGNRVRGAAAREPGRELGAP